MVIQKAVELGAGKIVLFESEHTVAKTNGKEERYSRIALEAAKQCGRSVITSVGIMSYDEVVGSIDEYDTAIFCNERDGTTPILRFLTKHGIKGNICIIVGAEGGFPKKRPRSYPKRRIRLLWGNGYFVPKLQAYVLYRLWALSWISAIGEKQIRHDRGFAGGGIVNRKECRKGEVIP